MLARWASCSRGAVSPPRSSTGGNPLVFGELQVPAAQRTLLFYAHYDGQPVDPKGWSQPSPFTPVLRHARLGDGGQDIPGFPRTAATPAGSAALRALGLRRQGSHHRVADGSRRAGVDEAASDVQRKSHPRWRGGSAFAEPVGNYGPLSRQIPRRSHADSRRPLNPSGKPTLSFGARGNLVFQLTTFGPKFALHSGHYGNWAPNPAWDMTRLLASMKDADGRVLVNGFYEDVPSLSPEERILAAVPDRPPN